MTVAENEICTLIARCAGATGTEPSEKRGVTTSATSQLNDNESVVEQRSRSDAKRKQLYLTPGGRVAASIADAHTAQMVTDRRPPPDPCR